MLRILFVFFFFYNTSGPGLYLLTRPWVQLSATQKQNKTRGRHGGKCPQSLGTLEVKAEIPGQPHLCSKLVLQEALPQTARQRGEGDGWAGKRRFMTRHTRGVGATFQESGPI